MDNKLSLLYSQIKEGKINYEEAAKRLMALAEHQYESSIDPNIYGWQPECYSSDERYIRDHMVNGECIILGVTYASLAINLFFKIFPKQKNVRIHPVNFITPVKIDETQQVEITLIPEKKGTGIDFKVWYRYIPSDTWNLTAMGCLQKEVDIGDIDGQIDLENIKNNFQKLNDLNFIFNGNPAVTLGESLRNITELYQDKDQVLAKVVIPQNLLNENHEYVLHPLIINSAFIGASAFLAGNNNGNDESYIPFGMNDLVFERTDSFSDCWLLIKLRKNSGELITFDVDVMNGQSKVVAKLSGCSLKKLHQGSKIASETYNILPMEVFSEQALDPSHLLGRIQKYLLDKLDKFVRERSKLSNLNYNLMDLGLTSNQLVALTAEIMSETNIELHFTLFFEYPNINELSKYFASEHRDAFLRLWSQGFEQIQRMHPEPQQIPRHWHKKSDNLSRNAGSLETRVSKEDIAIIGMHGLFPGATNLDQFWKLLLQNKDLIREIPLDHWDIQPWYDPNPEAIDKTYCKWGSFIDDVDKFDASFFNISPREAEWMDPQLRLLLQSIYATSEDAGYINRVRGSNTGLYVGVCFHDYMDRIIESGLPVDPYIETGNSQTVIANRVSFLFNLTGPSLSIDTACSSSLFALHLACQALQNKECEMAFVGGVNLLLSSYHYRYFSSIGALSPTGHCHSFDAAADGYVPGECVASILLKPLSKAQEDGDHIYALIKGSAALHGGYTPSLTAPSINGEENVILRAWKNAGINPETLSYIEAHGTGTKLGDPIEITSLQKAFRKFTHKSQFCSVGSIKSTLGHTEGAAGIAGVLKVVLQMKYGKIPVMPQFENLNPNIDLKDSALYINREIEEWPREAGIPRRAGISSFGFSGSYAHVVIEEYTPEILEPSWLVSPSNPVVIVLSAKGDNQLLERARQLLRAIHEQQLTDAQLGDIAYTLQVGREAMNVRLGMIVSSIAELIEKLISFIAEQDVVSGLYLGQIQIDNQSVSVFNLDEDMERLIDSWIDKRKYNKLLELWVKGLDINWERLYGDKRFNRVGLPTYPFAKERFWLPEKIQNYEKNAFSNIFIHPLLHRNTSDLTEQRFSSVFNGMEFFLANHVVSGYRILPGVTYLEMAREALSQSLGITKNRQNEIRIKNVVWIQPVALKECESSDETVEVHIGLYPEPNGEVSFEVYSWPNEDNTRENSDPVINSQGKLVLGKNEAIPGLDLNDLLKRCDRPVYTSRQWYDAIGTVYGPGFQGVQAIYQCQDYTLAKLSLPASVMDTWEDFVLHPSLMDSAVQVPLILANLSSGESALPFELQELVILSECAPVMWVLVREREWDKRRKFDLDLCDEGGKVCIQMRGLSSRTFESKNGPKATPNTGVLMLEPVWNEQESLAIGNYLEKTPHEYEQYLLVLCEPNVSISEINRHEIEERMKGISSVNRCLILRSRLKGTADRFINYASQVFEEIQKFIKSEPHGRILVQIIGSSQGESQLYSGLTGLLKTAELESSKLVGQWIENDFSEGSTPNDILAMVDKFKENHRRPMDGLVRYRDGQRMVIGWSEATVASKWETPWKDRGVYLITGGAGGIGQALTREIVSHAKNVTVVLTGRSSLGREKEAKLKELVSDGANVIYKEVDVTDKKAVTILIQNLHQEFGGIHGIIHGAGIIRDSYIVNKGIREFQEVLAPKVFGLVNLDTASKDIDLDLFIVLSSIASQGNLGQADYAAANSFMDAYATYRNTLVGAGQRFGKTLAIKWPLWKDGGMRISEANKSLMIENTGIFPIDTRTALRTLYQSFSLKQDQIMVLTGDIDRIKRKLFGSTSLLKSKETPASNVDTIAVDSNSLLDNVQIVLAQLVSKIQKIKISEIDINYELNKFGFDSITLTQLANILNKEYQLELTPTIFFEYPTLRRLAQFLVKEYSARLLTKFALVTQRVTVGHDTIEKIGSNLVGRRHHSRFSEVFERTGMPPAVPAEPIAVIGMSGKFPQAQDVDEFWQNLATGKDCITEIPPERWDWKEIFGEPATEVNKTNIKWGGFIDGVAEFDPLFFGISPREAELMDPQQRLLMTYAWHALEDAGISAQSISGTKTGIFVGTGNSGYDRLLAQANVGVEAYSKTGVLPSVGPNRMSYFLNIHGPSEPIETACSSSLVAIHRAVTALENGSCEMAIVGGINTIITPEEHLSFSKAGMLCEDGRCKTFSSEANGYVRGEGVGMLVLKNLKDAERHGDHIYGIIRGIAENHGGRVNSLTAPNPKAQAELLIAAYTKAGIDPRTVTYIEAHGTGTKLGDPIEINGLKTAFKELYQATGDEGVATGHCGLGSVKTNIGHLELASGIAGVIKVLLQIKARTLAKSLHCEAINPYIQLEDSPFYIVRETREWNTLHDAQGRELPRRAGVSSFGFGGANAHVVIEEYIPVSNSINDLTPEIPAIIVLSARDEERLRDRARQLLSAIDRGQFTDHQLLNVAYTLQVGRDAMEERLGFIASSIAEMKEKLRNFVETHEDVMDVYRGQVKRNKETLDLFGANKELQEAIEKWVQYGKYQNILELWVKGLVFDWDKLYPTRPGRVSLPTYPFVKEHYWAPDSQSVRSASQSGLNLATIHPLLHQNTSDFSEQRFSSAFTGQEFFLKDHVVEGWRILPGVTYLEMARAAMIHSIPGLVEDSMQLCLKNVVWIQPIAIRDRTKTDHLAQVHIGLYPKTEQEIDYEVYSCASDASIRPDDEADHIVHSQGIIYIGRKLEAQTLDIDSLLNECHQGSYTLSQWYDAIGPVYGPGLQGVDRIYLGPDYTIAKLILPATLKGTESQYVLHPTLMDSAVQVPILMPLIQEKVSERKVNLPFALDTLEIYGRCASEMWAWIRKNEGNSNGDRVPKYDIDLFDLQGNVRVKMVGLSARVLEGGMGSSGMNSLPLVFEPCWKPKPLMNINQALDMPPYGDHLVLLCEPGSIKNPKGVQEKIESLLHDLSSTCRCLMLQSRDDSIGKRFQEYAGQAFATIKQIFAEKPEERILVQIVTAGHSEQQLMAGLAGLLKTACLENSRFVGQMLIVDTGYDGSSQNIQTLAEKLRADALSPQDYVICYQDQGHGEQRFVAGWNEITTVAIETIWKDDGVYLISGGAGRLGLMVAEEIATTARHPTLVLTARTSLPKEQEARVEQLESLGARVVFASVDVTDPKAVNDLIDTIRRDFDKLNGVIHCAGVIHDALITKKTTEEFLQVLAPKVVGLENLDRATETMDLDCFVIYSSLSGCIGNSGQADYSTANAFMNEYAKYRQRLVDLNLRKGLTLSISWPLWKDGGMRLDAETERLMYVNWGLAPLETRYGMELLHQGLASGRSHIMVMSGNPVKIRQNLLTPLELSPQHEVSAVTHSHPTKIDSGVMVEKVRMSLNDIGSKILKINPHVLQGNAELNQFGFDSITLTEFTNELNQRYGLRMTPTLFFEYPTLQGLSEFLVKKYESVLAKEYNVSKETGPVAPQTVLSKDRFLGYPPRARLDRVIPQPTAETGPDAIAIIGMSGAFPMAKDLEQFWENLLEGKDCIQEIPEDRWDWRAYYGDPFQEANKTNIKWGGFIDGVAEFDPLFFGISPREAELMDPQQRLVMTYVWKVIEDAGYSAQNLAGTRTGIFVGTINSGYCNLIAQSNIAVEGNTAIGIVPSVGPNRMSYFLDIHGPSEPIETACSSSLVAIHRAVSAMNSGTCEMAIVGGVNTIVTPDVHISFNKAGMLCEDGRCKTFSNQANGYVRGEGVGMIFLKKLKDAEAAGDHIYAVIRGSAENHGGRANSLTAPNPNAQTDLLVAVYTKAGIDPRTVTYIEAHGTGTELGDPIEINALKNAFKQLDRTPGGSIVPNPHCGLGSVKTNIGHLELAAGIAGVIKVLLQFQHKTVVKSIHCDTINPYIQLEDSPFYIVRETQPWENLYDAQGRLIPRRAGVSSFGFGGVNAHVVLEEYIPSSNRQPTLEINKENPAMIIISAKNKERLQELARQLLDRIRAGRYADADLADLAYTLQVGREAMEERMGFIAVSLQEVGEKLQALLEHWNKNAADIHRGCVKHHPDESAAFAVDEDMEKTIDAWISKKKYSKILDLWVKGYSFDWNKLYIAEKPRHLSLPTYPFAKERYWVSGKAKPTGEPINQVGFDEEFYGQLIDEIIDDAISIESAVIKARK